MKRLEGRVAIVTGAGRGIGRGIAEGFAAEGARVVVNDINREAAEEVAAALGGMAMVADVTDSGAVEKMVADTVAHYGQLDIMMANAGIIYVKSVIETTDEMWDRTMDVNAKGVFNCLRAAARVMSAQGHGRIIALASSASKTAEAYIGAYSASKFAVWGLVQSLALELAPQRINVNCICPVNVLTPMNDYLTNAYAKINGITPEEQRRRYHEEIPWGRMATPQDVAKAAIYLASDDAEYLTGQGINVSGGLEFH
ncbi:MAG: SDR family NAD(P)-dependent oxidoreductase [Ardenticatenaceae bacterium]